MKLQNKHIYAVIMAGGAGTRFWPLSREKSPKQVLSITSDISLLSETIGRISGLVPIENILIVTSRKQVDVIRPQINGIEESNIIIEPTPRNTSPCIGLAAIHIMRRDPNGIMLVLPSDHLIKDNSAFLKKVQTGLDLVNDNDSLVTMGIKPTRAETGYGYIQFENNGSELPKGVYTVITFAEKPNKATAKRFVESGDFYWNSGIFMWSAQRILSEIEEHIPEQYEHLVLIDQGFDLDNFEDHITNHYNRIKPISIDYGIMEVTASPIFMISADFGWSDIGSWDELSRIFANGDEDNVTRGETVIIHSADNFIYSPEKLTAIIGMENVLVVNTPDATLICPLDRAQEVKAIVEKLRKDGRKEYL